MGHAPLAIWPAEAPEGVFFLGCCCLFRCEISEGGVIFGNIPGRRGGSRWGSLDLAFLPAYLARRGPPPRGRAVRVRAIAPAPRSVPRTTLPNFSRISPLGSANEKQTSRISEKIAPEPRISGGIIQNEEDSAMATAPPAPVSSAPQRC